MAPAIYDGKQKPAYEVTKARGHSPENFQLKLNNSANDQCIFLTDEDNEPVLSHLDDSKGSGE